MTIKIGDREIVISRGDKVRISLKDNVVIARTLILHTGEVIVFPVES